MRRTRVSLVLCYVYLLAVAAIARGASPPKIRDVSIAPAFFNPTAGQSVRINFHAAVAGTAKVTILDRDRFPVRALAPVAVKPGAISIAWDGRDDQSTIVPDEAWNVRIELAGEVYDPSLDFHPVMEDPQPRTYSRYDGVLSYKLARPARVHIEAGQATPNAKTKRSEGPILKTIVNREPRVAGAIVERWNGFDESGTIRVCDLPRFVVSVLATSLPDNSIITRGSRGESFLEYARRHRPASALEAKKRQATTHHHAGLNAFEDRSPSLRLKSTRAANGALRVEVNVEGPTAAHFLKQPGKMSLYVDETRVVSRENPASGIVLTVPADALKRGERRIAVNWGSDFGPAAVNSFLIDIPAAATRAAAAAGGKR
jgi:hypothetical protein